MKSAKLCLGAALVLLAVLGAAVGPANEEAKNKNGDRRNDGSPPAWRSESKYSKTIFFAVLEGLYEDGVSTEAVDAILARGKGLGVYQHFVQDCPICTPAKWAFEVYRDRPVLYILKDRQGGTPVTTFGQGLPDGVMRTVKEGKPEERLKAIQELVQSWIARKLSEMRLTEEERREYTAAFEKGRKDGMAKLDLLSQLRKSPMGVAFVGVKSCAVCDGVNGACGKR